MSKNSTERERYLNLLAEMCAVSQSYPFELHACEVSKKVGGRSGGGGFSDCWEGLFLGQHTVAMKVLHHRAGVHSDVFQRVSL